MVTFKLTIVTPERILFDGDAVYLHVPGGAGSMGILANHAPLLSSLVPGTFELWVPSSEDPVFFRTTKNGFIEVLKNNVSILLDASDSFAIPAGAPVSLK